jgi:hypothetical protein
MDHTSDADRQIDGRRNGRGADRLIGDLAGGQHGIVARWQLLELGLSGDAIDGRLRAARLHPLHRAVYAVGHKAAKREARWMAAVLAGGPGAVLSHRAAGANWGICGRGSGAIAVTVARQRRCGQGIVFHRSALPPDERTTHDNIPTTTVPRTLFDLAATLNPRQLERAINEAEVLQLWDDLSLHDLLRRYPRRKGSRALRELLHARGAGASLTESDLEVLFLTFADGHALPQPETNALVEGFRVDCVWRERRVVLEVDGWEVHRTRQAFERDRRKSRVLQARDWRCIPVTYRQLTESPDEVARDVRALLAPATLAA